MNIDLRKLYGLKKLEIDETVLIPEAYYQKLDIMMMEPVQVKGQVLVDGQGDIALSLALAGTFILPCSISREAVTYPFTSLIEETIEQNIQNNEINLALLDILWENIVLEVPIKVVKEGVTSKNIKGEGWELED